MEGATTANASVILGTSVWTVAHKLAQKIAISMEGAKMESASVTLVLQGLIALTKPVLKTVTTTVNVSMENVSAMLDLADPSVGQNPVQATAADVANV